MVKHSHIMLNICHPIYILPILWCHQINSTENRSVLHIALRAPRDTVVNSDGKNVVPDVWQVLDKIKDFSERVRSGAWVITTCSYFIGCNVLPI